MWLFYKAQWAKNIFFINQRFNEFFIYFHTIAYEYEYDIKVLLHIYKIAISIKISTPCT